MYRKRLLSQISDRQWVEGLLSDDPSITRMFLYEYCTPLLSYLAYQLFNYNVDKGDMADGLYMYLRADDWKKLRMFHYESRFSTWLSVVATRFFLRNKKEMELRGSGNTELDNEWGEDRVPADESKLDINRLLYEMPNQRYSYVIRKLVIEERPPQELADEMGVTTDNLYNMKRRALQSLKQMIEKEKIIHYDRFEAF